MSVLEDTLHERGKAALERCDAQISWYDQQSHLDGMLSRSFQVATIVLGALTPVLLLGGSSLPVALQALPSALAAIAAGVNGVFHWREDATRYASIREALKSERIKFLTRTTEEYHVALGEHQVLDRFMTRIEGLATREVSEWQHQDAKPAPSKPHPPVSSE